MSMTREEAIGYLRAAIAHAADVDDELGAYARTALSILAPSPRKEPPTVVGELICIDTSYAGGIVDFTLRCKIQEPMMRMKSGMQGTLSALPKGVE